MKALSRPRRPARTARAFTVALMLGMTALVAVQPGPAAHAGPVGSLAQHSASERSPARTMAVRIYLIAIGDNGRSGPRIGCGDSVIAVTRPIARTNAPLTAAMRILLSDHRRYYGQSGLYNALYRSRLTLQRASVVNGTATVHLAGRMSLGGVCDNPRVGAQLRRTALQFQTVRRTAIFVNNVPLWKRLSMR